MFFSLVSNVFFDKFYSRSISREAAVIEFFCEFFIFFGVVMLNK